MSETRKPETLAEVKAGDEVWWFGSRYEPPRLVAVIRVTPTQIIVDEQRYHRANGLQVGHDGFGVCPHIEVGTKTTERVAVLEATHRGLWARIGLGKAADRIALSQERVTAMRAACDRAEAALRELGEWSDAADIGENE